MKLRVRFHKVEMADEKGREFDQFVETAKEQKCVFIQEEERYQNKASQGWWA